MVNNFDQLIVENFKIQLFLSTAVIGAIGGHIIHKSKIFGFLNIVAAREIWKLEMVFSFLFRSPYSFLLRSPYLHSGRHTWRVPLKQIKFSENDRRRRLSGYWFHNDIFYKLVLYCVIMSCLSVYRFHQFRMNQWRTQTFLPIELNAAIDRQKVPAPNFPYFP